MVKTDPKITSRKVILDSDDELKESAVKPNTTPELSLSAPATAEATIVTLPNSDQVPVRNTVAAYIAHAAFAEIGENDLPIPSVQCDLA